MSCVPANMPVTGDLRIAFLALIVLLVLALVLRRRFRPPPSRLLQSYAGASSVLAFLGMLCATDVGATDHELWTGVFTPIALAVFSVYAELWRTREPPTEHFAPARLLQWSA